MLKHSFILASILLVVPVLANPPAVRAVKGQPLPITESIPDDPELAKVIAPVKTEIQASFGKVLAQSPAGILRGRGGEENLLGYWVADAMRARAAQILGQPVHFAITNSGGLRANLRPGTVKVGDIYEILPFENELMVAEITGAELVSALREGIQRRGGEPLSGVVVAVSGTPEKPSLTVTWEDGRPIDPKEVVRVATSDYLLSSGDSMPSLKKGRNPITTGLTMRQVLMDVVTEAGKASKPIEPPTGKRYQVAPELMALVRERKLAW